MQKYFEKILAIFLEKKNIIILFFILFFSTTCTRSSLQQVLNLAGDNRSELEKVLAHYNQYGNEQKQQAAEFLIANMPLKHSYEGKQLEQYNIIFDIYDSLFQQKIYDREPKIISDTWKNLEEKYGKINVGALIPIYDCQNLSSEFLIQNIDEAFEVWQQLPHNLLSPDFQTFCEYILPYRVANEIPEVYRKRYYNDLKHILDTATCPESILHGFSTEFNQNRHYVASRVLWDYPVELPVSTMERIRKGACRHLTTLCALSMRACGLPVAIDRAVWANRSLGHSWNVLMLDSGKILPFDALDKRHIQFAYKPAKIFRRTYSINFDNLALQQEQDIPKDFIGIDEIDVTREYVPAYDIAVPLIADTEFSGKYAIICAFDNAEWRAIYYGKVKDKKLHFKNMAADVAYIGCFYRNGETIPSTRPFILRKDGSIDYCEADENNRVTVTLERKYPNSAMMINRAHGLLGMQAEGANTANFKNPAIFFIQNERTYHMTDSLVANQNKFRYVRLNFSVTRDANFAEVEFYGKKNINAKEEKLSGKIFGFPAITPEVKNPYINAMDDNIETHYIKTKRTAGWVGLDLGKPYYITRVRFCPRSDTNFILEGDDYELMYWSDSQWKSAGKKTAEQYNFITFENVPSKSMYLLHNHTRGKEERIFTYENGEQIWW